MMSETQNKMRSLRYFLVSGWTKSEFVNRWSSRWRTTIAKEKLIEYIESGGPNEGIRRVARAVLLFETDSFIPVKCVLIQEARPMTL